MKARPETTLDRPGTLSRRHALRLATGACGIALGGLSQACSSRVPAPRSVPPNPFVEGGKPLLVVVSGEDVIAMVRKGFEVLGGARSLLAMGSERALLKGNFVAPQRYPVSTAADFAIAVGNVLRGEGFQRTPLYEVHGSRMVAALAPDSFMRRVGVFDAVTAAGMDVVAGDFLDRDEFRLVHNPAWSSDRPVGVHRAIGDGTVVVSLPSVKRHGEARFTCALKMHFGAVLMGDRLVAHKNASAGRLDFFDERLVHFADAVRPQLNVVDARALLARNGPAMSAGAEVVRDVNRIVLCGDAVATDAYCARLLAQHDETFDVSMIDRQLATASKLGLGVADLDRIKVVEVAA